MKKIKLLAWLKNNKEWYYPIYKFSLDLSGYNYHEILHYYNDNNFLVYAWCDDSSKENKAATGRLFLAEYEVI